MSRIKQKKQGVVNSLVWTQQDTNEAKLSYDGTDFDFDAPVTVAGYITSSSNGIKTDTISEYTSATGVTVDGVLIKDNTLTAHKESVTEAAATVLTAAMSGKVFFVNGDSSTGAYTLPAPVAGLHYKWIFTGNNNTATVITTADTTDTSGDMFRGGLLVISADNDCTFVEASATDCNTLTLDDNLDNAACGYGSWVEIICVEDATWFVTGVINGNTDADGTGSAMFSDTDA